MHARRLRRNLRAPTSQSVTFGKHISRSLSGSGCDSDRGAQPKEQAVKIASKSLAAGAALVLATLSGVNPARSGDGAGVAAGLLGGFAAGAIIGSATAPRPYYGPAPVYIEPPVYGPAPMYVEPPCYWTRGEPMWNGYAWIRPRVQVCD